MRLREIGAFSNTKACKRKCQWYVICIFKTLFRQKPRFKKGDFYRSKLFNQFDRGITDTAQVENQLIILAGLGALLRKCLLGASAHNSSSFFYALRAVKKLLSDM